MLIDLLKYAENPAFYLEDGRCVSYAELDQQVKDFERRLEWGRGIVLLEADNSLPTMVAYLAAMSARCPVLLTEPGDQEKIDSLCSRFSILYHFNGPTSELTGFSECADQEIDPDLALMLSTSGSTGEPKFVCLSHENLGSNARSIAEYLSITSSDCAPTNLPFFYSYGMSVVHSHLVKGAALWLTNQSVMETSFWQRFDELSCTSFTGVPHTYEVLDKLGISTADRHSLRYCTQAGGKLSRELVLKNAEAADREGWAFYVMYGQTEAAPRIAYLPPKDALKYPEHIGVPVPGGVLSLVDENGAEITDFNREGELQYRGPNVMMGYAHGQQDLVSLPGMSVLSTGDIATRDPSGLYKIIGRQSRFLKLFGLRVSLDTVERYLAGQGVQAVCGGSDQQLGVLMVGSADPAYIHRLLAEWLDIPMFAIHVFPCEQIPLSSNGKVDFKTAHAQLLTKMQQAEKAKIAAPPDKPAQNSRHSKSETLLLNLFSEATGKKVSDVSLSLRQSGADSLSIVEVMMELEKHMDQIPDNWMDLPIQELADKILPDKKSWTQRLFSMQTVEAFVVFRALAIFCVVAHHFGWFAVPGGTTTLMFIIGGYLYLETNRDAIYHHGARSRLWGGLAVLVSTLIPVSLLVAIAQSLSGSDWHVSLLLPYENLSIYVNDIFGIHDDRHHVEWLWFIHVYLQVFMLLGLALSFQTVRRFLSDKPFEKMLGLFFALEAISAGIILLDSGRQDLGHSAAVLQYAPTTILPVVVFGALIALMETRREWQWVCLAGLSYAMLFMAGVFTQGGVSTLLLVGVLLVTKTIRLPGFLFIPAMLLSEASLFIYLLHKPIEFAIKGVMEMTMPPSVLVLTALLISLLLWPLWKTLVISKVRKLTAA